VSEKLHLTRFTYHVSSFFPTLYPSFFGPYWLRLLYSLGQCPEARAIYGADIAEVAHYVKTNRNVGLVAISAEYYRDLDPFRFSLHSQGQPPFVIWFDGRQSLAFPPPESSLSPRYIFPLSAPPAEIWQPFCSHPRQNRVKHTPCIACGMPWNCARLRWLLLLHPTTWESNINNDLILSAIRCLGQLSAG